METKNGKSSGFFNADTDMARQVGVLALETAQSLLQTQIDATDKVCSESARHCREFLNTRDPSVLFGKGSNTLQSSLQSANDVACAYLKASVGFQSELIRLFQEKVPMLHKHFADSLDESTRVSRTASNVLQNLGSKGGNGSGKAVKAPVVSRGV